MELVLKTLMIIVSASMILYVLYQLLKEDTEIEMYVNPIFYQHRHATYNHYINLIIKIFIENYDGMDKRIVSYKNNILEIKIKATNKTYIFNYSTKEPLCVSFFQNSSKNYIDRDIAYKLYQIIKYYKI